MNLNPNSGSYRVGHIGWNKGGHGRPLSEETKAKLRQINLGNVVSPETREKIRQGLLGKQRPQWVKDKISKGRMGLSFGPHSPEHRQKLHERAKRGESNPNWRGGITLINHGLRATVCELFEYFKWRTGVFTRDNFTCQKCGSRGVKLHAHHLIPFHKIRDEYNIKTVEDALACPVLWDVNNGATLCIPCHHKIRIDPLRLSVTTPT